MTAVFDVDVDDAHADWPKRTDDRIASILAALPAPGHYDLTDLRFNPNQPRDSYGRWGSGSGGVPEQTGYMGLNATSARAVTELAASQGLTLRAMESVFEDRIEAAKTMPDPYRPGMTAYAGGMTWYSQEAHDHALQVGDGDAIKGAGIIAALSGQCQWPSNKAAAACVADMSRRRAELGLGDDVHSAWLHYQQVHGEFGKDTKGNCGPQNEQSFAQAWRIANGEPVDSVLTGRKRRNFHNDIAGDPDSVTIDSQMGKTAVHVPGSTIRSKAEADAFLNKSWDDTVMAGKAGREPKVVDHAGAIFQSQAVLNVAHRLGLEPDQVQAIVWNTEVNEPWPTE